MHSRPDRPTNRTHLLDAATRLLVERGYDHVTANAIADAAGVSRGTLYGHFGDVGGLYASVWADEGDAWLRRAFTEPTMEWSDRDTALAMLCIVARRVPSLLEIVGPDLERAWSELTAEGEVTALRSAYLFAGKLGAHLVLPLLPESAVVVGLLPWCASIPDDVAALTGATDPAPPLGDDALGGSIPPVDESSPIVDRLAHAAMQVVASSGLTGATMMRICRVARVTTGAASPRFQSLEELHRFGFERALSGVIGTNSRQVRDLSDSMSPPDLQAAFVRAALSPDRRRWRQYRQEMLLAARHDPAAAKLTKDAYAVTNRGLHETFVRQARTTDEVAAFVVLFNVVFAAGQAAAAELGVPLAEMDHRPAIRWLYQLLTQPR